MADDAPRQNIPPGQQPQPGYPSPENNYNGSTAYYEYGSGNRASSPPPYNAGIHPMPPSGMPYAPYPPPERRPRMKYLWLYIVLAVVGVLLVVFAGSLALHLGWPGSKSASIPASTPTVSAPVDGTARSSPPATRASFQTSSCPFKVATDIVQGHDVRCGFVTVPEDRAQPQGRTIQLAVAIFRAAGSKIYPDPMLYLSGGPGGSAIGDFGPYIGRANAPDVTLGHDLILLDQRGTGFSRPILNCSELSALQRETQNQNMSIQQGDDLYVQTARKCHDRLVQSGINLNGYTTIADATDVHDVIRALGYKQINLYGVSYGTRLALTVSRLFPGDLRSVILDSTLPTQNNRITDYPSVLQHALDTLFQGCAADQFCHSTYPGVENTFYALVKKLDAHPVSFKDKSYGAVLLNGDGLANWVFSSMYVTSFIPDLPKAIMQISRGDFTIISQTYGLLILQDSISQGLYYSVECGEDLSFTTTQGIEQAAGVLHPEIRGDTSTDMKAWLGVCQFWGQKSVPVEQKQPVTSSIPTLILSGEYDPITPLSNAQQAMRTLSKSYLFVFPATGHGVFLTHPCPDGIMMAFLQNPGVKPDGTCTSTMPGPDFR